MADEIIDTGNKNFSGALPDVKASSGEHLAETVGLLLRERKATLALAESCTGGLLAHMLTSIPGSSDYFLLSAVTYANVAKMKILGVAAETLAQHGAVSEAVATEMALGARRALDADFGLAVTGIAGPGGGSVQKPVGTVCIGLSDRGATIAKKFVFKEKNRADYKVKFAVTALDLLHQKLLQKKDAH